MTGEEFLIERIKEAQIQLSLDGWNENDIKIIRSFGILIASLFDLYGAPTRNRHFIEAMRVTANLLQLQLEREEAMNK
jgi:hypothetical protein